MLYGARQVIQNEFRTVSADDAELFSKCFPQKMQKWPSEGFDQRSQSCFSKTNPLIRWLKMVFGALFLILPCTLISWVDAKRPLEYFDQITQSGFSRVHSSDLIVSQTSLRIDQVTQTGLWSPDQATQNNLEGAFIRCRRMTFGRLWETESSECLATQNSQVLPGSKSLKKKRSCIRSVVWRGHFRAPKNTKNTKVKNDLSL